MDPSQPGQFAIYALGVRLPEIKRVLDLVPVGVAIAEDPDGRTISVNAAAAELLDVPSSENASWTTLGSAPAPFRFFRGAHQLERDELPLRRALNGETVREELRLERQGRAAAELLVQAAPLYDEAGRIQGGVAALVDMTEQKAIEEALREAARRKDQFLAVLGHELRNPLAALQNSLALLSLAGDDAATAAKARAMMQRQLASLTRLVDDLLDVSRISRGKIAMQKERVDLVSVVRSAVDDHADAADARGVRLALKVPEAAVDVWCDTTRVAQAVGNVLQNAVKFSEPGGRIDVCLACESEQVSVEVKDDGIGMDAETIRTIFEPFRQADHRRGGLGLGLALARRMVELNGGTMSASSEGPGKGATFVVKMPAARKRPVTVPALSVPPEPQLRSRRRVLIVEDNADAAESLAAFLEIIGHEVVVAADGSRAVEKALSFTPEVVLCDIDLPGMDGYAVAAALRREPSVQSAYLVAMTGYGQPEDKRKAAEHGFDAHLTKPTDPALLERLLSRLPAGGAGATPPVVERTFF